MTNTVMTSKERLLSAINIQPVDHIPLLLRFWSLGGEVDNIPFNWGDEVERVKSTLELGLDDTLMLEPPLGYVENYIVERAPGVVSQVEVLEPTNSEGTPLLKKTYSTPAGPLQTVIKITEDWTYGEDIRLFDDQNIPRLVEPLVKDMDDIHRLQYLLAEPSPQQMDVFHKRSQYLRQSANKLGAVLDGGWVALGDAAMWLCGMERILYGQMDDPDFLEALLETIFQWEMRRIDLMLEHGIEVLVHMAWYETTDFWTPKNYRKLIKPRLVQEIEKAHTHGVKFRYIITKSWIPYREDFLEMKIDCLTGIDPVQDKIDLAEVKVYFDGKICLMGGINSAVMLTRWSDDEIRKAVDEAIDILAPGGGFILYPVDAVYNNQPWSKVEGLINQWKKRRVTAS